MKKGEAKWGGKTGPTSQGKDRGVGRQIISNTVRDLKVVAQPGVAKKEGVKRKSAHLPWRR